MPALTLQHLDPRVLFSKVPAVIVRRGRAYFNGGRVEAINLDESDTAICKVDGDSGEYTVTIGLGRGARLPKLACDCPYAESHAVCKHMVACVLELREYLSEVAEDDDPDDETDEPAWTVPPLAWRPPPGQARRTASRSKPKPRPDSKPKPKPDPKPKPKDWRRQLATAFKDTYVAVRAHAPRPVVAAVVLERVRYGGRRYGTADLDSRLQSIHPVYVNATSWDRIKVDKPTAPEDVNAWLQSHSQWHPHVERLLRPLGAGSCLNLDADAVAVLNTMTAAIHGRRTGEPNFADYLSLLSRTGIPLFEGIGYPLRIQRPLRVVPRPVELEVDLSGKDGTAVLRLGTGDGEEFRELPAGGEVLCRRPLWLLAGDIVMQVGNEDALPLVGAFPLEIPTAHVDEFRDRFADVIAKQVRFRGESVTWREVETEPVPHLILRDQGRKSLVVELRFHYGDVEIAPERDPREVETRNVPGTWIFTRVRRHAEREDHFVKLVKAKARHLKRSGATPGEFELRTRSHPLDFLADDVPLLAQAGFVILGAEDLKVGRINRNTPTVRMNITSGLDWFDLHAVVTFGELEVSLREIRRASARGERFVKLADGSLGRIPAEWLEQYRRLWGLAEPTEDGLRVRDCHLPLLDKLLEEQEALTVPAELTRRRERLRDFAGITEQKLPPGFNGVLRPYQKHGFDWLHFLGSCGFGGILADDMGLGKTVQVLAYLLSRHRGDEVRPATLLVVPRSLVLNWQIEARRFAPDLRILDHSGTARNRGTASFDGWDIVLTTYGAMLRDIEDLRRYDFSHVVLDESQAIKNPLAKCAKAARLLRGGQRLVMTGTPVENSTFELWSQFAFVNPGLLGTREYFRREFAGPIEHRGDPDGSEVAIALLRRLTHPFIMRRAKEQVAPELPPRTERVVYTEMGPAQRRLYAQTRDKYRAELLSLIERRGMNDARFRILEGLLRLRQIAVHPALVQRGYDGEAAKFEAMYEILETLGAERHKALVFSQFVETLKLVKSGLEDRGIRYAYLDGRTRDRQARVDTFQADPELPIFLISLKAGGVGLNLTAADYVIHLDPWWNPAVEMQASDRAHRIGQTRPVIIYKLIARDTVEEKILELQERKRSLVRNLINAEAGFLKSLTRDDIETIFG
jgi:non-specific serine/threonine protein kinase